uniref:C2H2-type domain-containing protein n=1 Tax=Arion vulgaris TaxID=1028688 RepID=A0A0B6ZL64_9EUPU
MLGSPFSAVGLKFASKSRTPVGNIECEVCGKRFPSRRSLQGHMNSFHLHQKPYICQKCNRSFAYQTSLYFHERLCYPKIDFT